MSYEGYKQGRHKSKGGLIRSFVRLEGNRKNLRITRVDGVRIGIGTDEARAWFIEGKLDGERQITCVLYRKIE